VSRWTAFARADALRRHDRVRQSRKSALTEMLTPELLRLAGSLGVKYRWEMKRLELVEAIRAARGSK
jgi:hypothetical protein